MNPRDKMCISLEGLYSSNMRNSFVLFTLGLTIMNLSKKKYKSIFSLCIIILGILLGIVSTYEFNNNIKTIKENKDDYNYSSSKNIYLFCAVLILLIIIFFYRIAVLNEQFD